MNWMKYDKYTILIFPYQILVYGYLMGGFLYSMASSWPNLIGALWNGLHAWGLVNLMVVVIMIRILLPRNTKGAVYSMLAGLFCPLSGETIFMPFYWYWLSRYDPSLPAVGGIWLIGQWGFLLLWMITILTGTHHLFSFKRLTAGVLALLPVMFYWKYAFNFFLWNYATTPLQLFIGDLFTIIYYTIWPLALIIAFVPEGLVKI